FRRAFGHGTCRHRSAARTKCRARASGFDDRTRHADAVSALSAKAETKRLIGVFGTPSPLTYWTLHAVRTIAQALDPDSGFLQANRIADLQPAWDAIPERSRRNVVFFSDCPDSQISSYFLSLGVPILFVADEPQDMIPFIAVQRDLPV